MPKRNLIGSIVDSTGAPWANARVSFQYLNGYAGPKSDLSQNRGFYVGTANAAGVFSIPVLVNEVGGDGVSYQGVGPDGKDFTLGVPAVPNVDLDISVAASNLPLGFSTLGTVSTSGSGGGGSGGLTLAQTQSAVQSGTLAALNSATTLDELEPILRDIDPSGLLRFRDSDPANTPFLFFWEVDKETDVFSSRTLTLTGADYTPTGAQSTWTAYVEAGSTPAAATPRTPTNRIVSTDGAGTTTGSTAIAAGATFWQIRVDTGTFVHDGITYPRTTDYGVVSGVTASSESGLTATSFTPANNSSQLIQEIR